MNLKIFTLKRRKWMTTCSTLLKWKGSLYPKSCEVHNLKCIKPNIKAVGFDLVNTLLDVSELDKEELDYYINIIREDHPENKFRKFINLDNFPESWYTKVNLFPSTLHLLQELKNKGFFIFPFSNLPEDYTKHIFADTFNLIPNICERFKHYKPNPIIYKLIYSFINAKLSSECKPLINKENILIVTNNYTFGDLEQSCNAGMHSYYLNRKVFGGTCYKILLDELIGD